VNPVPKDIGRDQALELCGVLARLFAAENPDGTNAYLTEHGRPQAIASHVNAFCWYARHFPDSGAVLDWGCNHGPDSCLVRAAYGETLALHACDIIPASDFPKFRAFARPTYKLLADNVQLPYRDGELDAVIGSGVLEHVAMDYESLREIHRVLRPGGLFVVTLYPHEYSFVEWWRRRVKKRDFHARRTTLRGLEILLKHAGLLPFELTYQLLLPDVAGVPRRSKLRVFVDRYLMPSVHFPVLCALARKVNWM
jgi:SAM-dependent methyltransferase